MLVFDKLDTIICVTLKSLVRIEVSRQSRQLGLPHLLRLVPKFLLLRVYVELAWRHMYQLALGARGSFWVRMPYARVTKLQSFLFKFVGRGVILAPPERAPNVRERPITVYIGLLAPITINLPPTTRWILNQTSANAVRTTTMCTVDKSEPPNAFSTIYHSIFCYCEFN